ncbi:peptidyl-prolyl cis-trans isomerase-like [Lolium rigidum]|uniref:peptidyl-prolyl cis-trans isomerase-like n=1 Tax=Lolium rigidum TaxID=89674 RepID=UPI001F5D0300|nr:peptidyl-prolyl cis-trans isomerase-like [Lolium rigidum]
MPPLYTEHDWILMYPSNTPPCPPLTCSEVVPKMIDNFHFLCTGEKGDVYKGCFFHRIIKGFHDSGWGFCRKTMSEEH